MEDDVHKVSKASDEERLNRSRLEEDLQNEREAVHNVRKQLLERIAEIAEKRPKIFCREICKAVLAGPGSNYLFSIETEPDEDDATRKLLVKACDRYKYLSILILKKIKYPKREEFASEFVSLRDLIEWDFCFSAYELGARKIRAIDMRRYSWGMRDIWDEFFEQYSYVLGLSILGVTERVFQGVPIYIFDSTSKGYIKVGENDKEYCYLNLRGKYSDVVCAEYLPDWADKYFMKSEDFRWHEILFFNNGDTLSERETESRRAALRKQIGLSSEYGEKSPDSIFSHQTRLLSILEAVIARYYSDRFDESDPDTWTKQTDVIDWLKTEWGLSGNEAKAIDMVARPDKARNR